MDESIKIDLASFPAEVTRVEQRKVEGKKVGYAIGLSYEHAGQTQTVTLYFDTIPRGLNVDEDIYVCLEMRS